MEPSWVVMLVFGPSPITTRLEQFRLRRRCNHGHGKRTVNIARQRESAPRQPKNVFKKYESRGAQEAAKKAQEGPKRAEITAT